MKISVFRKAHFNAAHRLYNPLWTDQKNLEFYGKCSNPNYHGHNYNLEVKVTGVVDPITGFLIDLSALSKIIEKHVEEKFDHKNINLEVDEFCNPANGQHLNPSTENICIVIYNVLRNVLDTRYDIQVRLYESERNFVEYPVV